MVDCAPFHNWKDWIQLSTAVAAGIAAVFSAYAAIKTHSLAVRMATSRLQSTDVAVDRYEGLRTDRPHPDMLEVKFTLSNTGPEPVIVSGVELRVGDPPGPLPSDREMGSMYGGHT